MTIKYSVLIFFATLMTCQLLTAQPREINDLKTGWKFSKGSHEMANQVNFDDSDWRDIEIPHDWAIEEPFVVDGDGNTGKLPWKGEGWYRNQLDIPDHYNGKRLYLICDGIMAFPLIYLNGKLAGKWDYGYNSFYVDITDFIDFEGVNTLAIHVDTRQHDSRWYPGAGIYRKIQLLAVNPVHVDIWGTYITTPKIESNYAHVKVATTVNNTAQGPIDVRIVHRIIAEQGNTRVEKDITGTLAGNIQELLETTITLPSPKLWEIGRPYLYKLLTSVYSGDELLDEYTSSFGIRDFLFTADHGFFMNGQGVQLKGVNLHHDHGPLGAAFNTRAMERQLEIMQGMGCNAIRTSHNTAAPELLDLCDKMGLLVFNEIFDKYDAKAGIVDTTHFENFTHRNMRNFVLRDRNHPSVFLWSVGNEIGDVQWNLNNGFDQLQTMIENLEKYDTTRLNTLVCDAYKSAELRHFDYYDVHCWNYDRRYRMARELEPNKSVIISESASTLSTRGFYEFPLPEEKTDFTKSLQVSSYDLNAPYWAEVADDDFMWQQQEPYIAGEFVWTGFDYLGEPTPYNNEWVNSNGMTDREASRSSYFGIVDLCGIPKDRYYLYKSYWKPNDFTAHILPHWNWQDRIGKKTPVFVYTSGDCAELFLNGESQGIKCKKPESENSIERFRLMWNDVIYQPGELRVEVYRGRETQIGEASMKTAGAPTHIKLTPDRSIITADGSDLSYILIEARDEDGLLCPLADHLVEIEISGDGKIAGVGNGNPQSMAPFKSHTINMFYGKAMLIIGAGYTKGNLEVRASADGLSEARVTIGMQ